MPAPDQPAIVQPATVQPASPTEIKTWLERHEILLVDVREPKEYEAEHIAGAVLLPLSSFEPEIFPTLPGRKIVLHCAIGKRSEAAGKMLLKEGHSEIIHMTGGMEAWKAAGLPTEIQLTPPGGAPSPEPVFLCPLPGTVLAEEYLRPLKIAAPDLARAIGVLAATVNDLLNGKAPVSVELSLRLARYFSTAGDFWIRLQTEHDLERARHSIGEELRRTITPRTQAG